MDNNIAVYRYSSTNEPYEETFTIQSPDVLNVLNRKLKLLATSSFGSETKVRRADFLEDDIRGITIATLEDILGEFTSYLLFSGFAQKTVKIEAIHLFDQIGLFKLYATDLAKRYNLPNFEVSLSEHTTTKRIYLIDPDGKERSLRPTTISGREKAVIHRFINNHTELYPAESIRII